MKKNKTWKDASQGGILIEPGNSKNYETGSWRTFRPVRIKEKCTNCLICFIYCPDCAITVKKDKWEKFDYQHCKGCGICSQVCPFGAIKMVNENDRKEHK